MDDKFLQRHFLEVIFVSEDIRERTSINTFTRKIEKISPTKTIQHTELHHFIQRDNQHNESVIRLDKVQYTIICTKKSLN